MATSPQFGLPPARNNWRTITVAAAGSDRASGTLISGYGPMAVLVTGADATVGVRLPPAQFGRMILIKNRDSENAVLKVYPFESTSQINAITAGSSLSMAAKTSALFFCMDNGGTPTWYTLSLLPS